MQLNLTVNESCPPPPPTTPGTYNVRAYYDETGASHLSGPFSTREAAEAFANALVVRPGFLRASIEEVA